MAGLENNKMGTVQTREIDYANISRNWLKWFTVFENFCWC